MPSVVRFDAFQPQQPEQIQTRPARTARTSRQETLAREQIRTAAPGRRCSAYLSIAASSTNPITTFTRASHPPLWGSFFRYDGNSARKKNGERQSGGEADHAEHGLQASGLHRRRQQACPQTVRRRRTRSAKTSGPSAACRSIRRAAKPVELGQQPGGQRDLERAQQAQREDEEDQRDESVHPWIRRQLHDAERADERGHAESQRAEQARRCRARRRAPA